MKKNKKYDLLQPYFKETGTNVKTVDYIKFPETKWRNIIIEGVSILEIQRRIVKKLQVCTSDNK